MLFLTPQEAAKSLGVSRLTVMREIQRGRLEAHTVGLGSRYRISDAELKAYRRRNRVQPKVREEGKK